MPPIGTDEVWQLATARWAEIARIFPDLEPALALQQRLSRILLDASAALEHGGLDLSPTVSDAIFDKWMRGLPAFHNETFAIPSGLARALPQLCTVLVEGGAGEAADHLQHKLDAGEIDPDSLLRTSLARNQKAIRVSALHMGLAPDLVWLVGELGSSPLAHHLQKTLLSRPNVAEHLAKWDRGYCPCCGSWPAFIEAAGGRRLLRCSYCAAAWELSSERCVYCSHDGNDFLRAAPDPSRPNRRVELCRACGNYTKVVETAVVTPFPLLALEDLASIDLDNGAMTRQYGRPSMIDLDSIERAQEPSTGRDCA